MFFTELKIFVKESPFSFAINIEQIKFSISKFAVNWHLKLYILFVSLNLTTVLLVSFFISKICQSQKLFDYAGC